MSTQGNGGVASGIEPGLASLLEHMVKINASDLYLTVGSPPVFCVGGEHYPARTGLVAEQLKGMLTSVMDPHQRAEFVAKLEMNVRVATAAGQFRVNVFMQRGLPAMVVRLVRSDIPTFEGLGMSRALASLAEKRDGLVLFVGGAGSGRSAAMAAAVDHRNAHMPGHILTVEEPIEYVHQHKQCIVSQREVGFDTPSYGDALRGALRQAPDVVAIADVRDADTMDATLSLADTGCLCLATLHAHNTVHAVQRVLSFFAGSHRDQACSRLAQSLRGIVALRPVANRKGGQTTVAEVLLDTPRVVELINRGDVSMLEHALQHSEHEGCRTFDSSLLALVARGEIAPARALDAAERKHDFRQSLERLRDPQSREVGTGAPLRLVAESPAPSAEPAAEPAPPGQRVSETRVASRTLSRLRSQKTQVG